MQDDPLTRLKSVIAAAAQERDLKQRKERDVQMLRERQREEAKAIWATRRKELPGLVAKIDGLLTASGYAGLKMGVLEAKHSDIDRVILKFEHTPFNNSNILICATLDGQFTCSIGAAISNAGSTTELMSNLTATGLEAALTLAVEECLKNKRPPVVL